MIANALVILLQRLESLGYGVLLEVLQNDPLK